MVLFIGGSYWFYELYCDRVPITGRKRWLRCNSEYDEEIGHLDVSVLLRQVSCSLVVFRNDPSFAGFFLRLAQVMASPTIG